MFLRVSGILAWTVLAFFFVAFATNSLLNRAKVRRIIWHPSVFPYFLALTGSVVAALRRLRLVPSNHVTRSADTFASLDESRSLSAAIAEVDALPTVRRGLEALHLESMMDLPPQRVALIPSPYTHPMQHPAFYIPGVPARPFYDKSEFPWATPLEDAFPIIREELERLLSRNGQGFKSYVGAGNAAVRGWNTFNFFFFGKKFEENCALCPNTTAVLESLPSFERDHIMFSALNPHTRIPPHTGQMNGIIRAHLPLICRPGSFIRVGSEERTWEEGRLLIFDDSFDHEVWNHSDHVRIVLFMNFWHPCFSASEIPSLERLRIAYERHPVMKAWAKDQEARRRHDIVMPTRPQAAVPAKHAGEAQRRAS